MRVSVISAPQNKSFSYGFRPSLSNRNFAFSFWMHPSNLIPMKSITLHAKKRNSQTEPVLKPTLIEEASMDNEDEEEQLLFGDLEDGNHYTFTSFFVELVHSFVLYLLHSKLLFILS